MDTRIALIGVLLETRESVDKLNHLLSDYGEYVIGRMGLPYKEKGIHIYQYRRRRPEQYHQRPFRQTRKCSRASAPKTIYRRNNVTYL